MGRYKIDKKQKSTLFGLSSEILVVHIGRIKTIFSLLEYAKMRSINNVLISITILILITLIYGNKSRLTLDFIEIATLSEKTILSQAKEQHWPLPDISSVYTINTAAKTFVIGLISSSYSINARLLISTKYAIKSIYYLVSDSVKSFQLWGASWVTLMPKYRVTLMSWVSPYVSAPQSALVNGMVFGDDSDIPQSIRHSVAVIGMQHVLAASGFNVGLVLTLTKMVFRRFCHPTITAVFCLAGIVGYVLLIGAPASAVRAGIMVAYALLATSFVRRQFVAWYTLIVCAVVMLLANREYLSSISFQLSISATLGIILVEPRLSEGSTWFGALNGVGDTTLPKFFDIFKEAAITTIAAQAFTIPLLLYHFGELSSLSLVANVALLWLTPLITVGGIWLVLFAGMARIVPILTIVPLILGIAINGLSSLFLYLVSWLGQATWSLLVLPVEFPLGGVFLWWLLLSVWLLCGKKTQNHVLAP